MDILPQKSGMQVRQEWETPWHQADTQAAGSRQGSAAFGLG
jgi:hypothetical protein